MKINEILIYKGNDIIGLYMGEQKPEIGYLYHASFDDLIPVAKKLKKELSTAYPDLGGLGTLLKSQSYIIELNSAAGCFEIKPLFEKVIECIGFLNQLKKSQVNITKEKAGQ